MHHTTMQQQQQLVGKVNQLIVVCLPVPARTSKTTPFSSASSRGVNAFTIRSSRSASFSLHSSISLRASSAISSPSDPLHNEEEYRVTQLERLYVSNGVVKSIVFHIPGFLILFQHFQLFHVLFHNGTFFCQFDDMGQRSTLFTQSCQFAV